MGTYSALHVERDQLDRVREACAAWLEGRPGVRAIEVRPGEFPTRAFAKGLGDRMPRLLALGSTPPGWVTIHYNSFHKMENLAPHLSRLLDARVAVVLAQTVSDGYYICVYDRGEPVRVLEVVQGTDWLMQAGAPLPFEEQPLGENVAEPGEEPFYFFGAQQAEAYCNGLGFSIFDAEYALEWVVLSVKRKGWWPL
jgi:hypothetical protein